MRLPNGMGSASKIGGSKKRRKPWRARVTDCWVFDEEKGKAVQKFRTLGYFASKKEALLALSEYHKQPSLKGTAQITFADVYELWKERNHPKMTKTLKSSYETLFRYSEALHGMKMHEIKTEHMQDIMDAYPNAFASQKRLRTLWGKLFRLAMERDIVHKDYAQFVALRSADDAVVSRKPFTKEQIATLWENQERLPGVDLILIMVYTGVRPSELLSIDAERVHLADRWIDLHGTKTKAAKRAVPIHHKIAPLIEQRLQGSQHLVAMAEDGRRMKYAYFLRYVWTPIMKALGFEDRSPHGTRHAFVSLMTEAGADERILKKIVGHSDQSVTDVYRHAFLETILREVERITV